jgi:hypothetical protein
MESPRDRSRIADHRQLKHPLAACGLVASLVGLATLAVTTTPAVPLPVEDIRAPGTSIALDEPVEPDSVKLRAEFFAEEVQPRIELTDSLNRQAAERCVTRLEALMDKYRQGVGPFVSGLTSLSTRLGIVKRMPADWWKQDGRVEAYVQTQFEQHLFSEQSLARDVSEILDAFRSDVDANQRRMLVEIRASLDSADLPEIAIEDYDSFLSSVAQQLQQYSSQQGSTSVQSALTVLVLSEAGSYAAVTLASGLLARFGAAAATTAAAAGGATAGASAAGAGGGSLGGPVGTAVGLGVGLVIGLAIDWWMTEKFETELSRKMHRYLDDLEQSILHGNPRAATSSPAHASTAQETGGISDALPIVCDQLRDAYHQRFRTQIFPQEQLP